MTKREWNHNIEYHRIVLSAVPSFCSNALEVGCGEGALTRQLASVCEHVTGIDLDSRVITAALNTEPRRVNVAFTEGDIMVQPFLPARFMFLCSVATLHHLPLEPALIRFRELLVPGGVLAIVGLYRPQGAKDLAFGAAGFVASQAKRRLYKYGEMNAPMQEPQQTMQQIRKAAKHLLPGSSVRQRLYFRYSLVWHKPGSMDQRQEPPLSPPTP